MIWRRRFGVGPPRACYFLVHESNPLYRVHILVDAIQCGAKCTSDSFFDLSKDAGAAASTPGKDRPCQTEAVARPKLLLLSACFPDFPLRQRTFWHLATSQTDCGLLRSAFIDIYLAAVQGIADFLDSRSRFPSQLLINRDFAKRKLPSL